MGVAEGGDAVMEELKEVVTQTLEKKGVLAKIKAELRASVFEAIDEQGNSGGMGPPGGLAANVSERFHDIQGTELGPTVLHLIYEYLEWCQLDYTIKVFSPETCFESCEQSYPGRQGLVRSLNLRSEHSNKRPLLCAVLEKFRSGGGGRPSDSAGSMKADASRSMPRGIIPCEYVLVSAVWAFLVQEDTGPTSPEVTVSPTRDPLISPPGAENQGVRGLLSRKDDLGMASTFAKDSNDDMSGLYGKANRPHEDRKEEREPRSGKSSPSPAASPSTSMDDLGNPKDGPLGALPSLRGGGLGGRSALDPLPPLGGGVKRAVLAPLEGVKSPAGSEKSLELNRSGDLGLSRSGDLGRSLELGRSADFSDHYSAEFDVEEVIEEDGLEVAPPDDMQSEDSYVFADENPAGASSMGGKMSMDMLASGLSASDRSGELDLDEDADLIESAEMG
ncbi:hypothetical protein CYMTET_45628 [Cymbomonas tetramitiformis]|uniref:FGFR1 oncogene partner (FOP) N-terminal dimerisation domain-containing protein n=1 Tax=Cymbomonas tetramitiformis TaxID=36881 RepID=A0AAE0BZ77_9CHLO|nr:hypothetical protein CYMTET_45628 [Cymbomonas tetramitiformis]